MGVGLEVFGFFFSQDMVFSEREIRYLQAMIS